MRYDVLGAWRYSVGVSPKRLGRGDSRRMGEFDEQARAIRICPTCPPANRLQVLLHELGHAWVAHAGGVPRDEEVVCDLLAAFTASALRWLSINGGETALMRLRPGEALQPATARIALGQSRQCAQCGGTQAPGDVECHPDADKPGMCVLRLYCDFCGHLQVWGEKSGPTGHPTAEVVTGPEFRRGLEVARFLERRPTAAH